MRTCTRCGEEKGASHFYRRKTGKVCAQCKACLSEERRAHYLANRAEKIAAAARWKADHPLEVKRIGAEEARRNKARKNATRQVRRRANPHLVAEEAARARAQRRRASPSWRKPPKIRAIYQHARFLTRATGIAHHVDHVVPLNSRLVCGLHVEANLAVKTGRENQAKSNLTWPDMP